MEDFCLLEKAHGEWYRQRGCHLTKVPVPKGGMVLWDSRLVHDNCRLVSVCHVVVRLMVMQGVCVCVCVCVSVCVCVCLCE